MYSHLRSFSFGASQSVRAAVSGSAPKNPSLESAPPELLTPKDPLLDTELLVLAPGFKGPSKEEEREIAEHTRTLTWRETYRDGTSTECQLTKEQYDVLTKHGGVQKWTNEVPKEAKFHNKNEFYCGDKKLNFLGASGCKASDIHYFPADSKQPYYCIRIDVDGTKKTYRTRAEFSKGEGYKN